jgi:hypothetical protein
MHADLRGADLSGANLTEADLVVESLVFGGFGQPGPTGSDGIVTSADAEASKHKRAVE